VEVHPLVGSIEATWIGSADLALPRARAALQETIARDVTVIVVDADSAIAYASSAFHPRRLAIDVRSAV
jgi:hypothetical protein